MTSTIPRTAIVTGGSGGLGTAVIDHLLACGWRIVVPWLDESECDSLVPHANLELVRTDLAVDGDIENVVELAGKDEFRPLFGVVNLVGGHPTPENPVDVLDAQLTVDLRIAYGVIQTALPHLIRRGGGSVVCIGSATTAGAFPGSATYIASKAAVGALVQTLAAEYARDNIRVNGLLPTMIDTTENLEDSAALENTSWLDSTDIAAVIEFLLSDSSRAITGASIPISNLSDDH